jgi:hypothetical protein
MKRCSETWRIQVIYISRREPVQQSCTSLAEWKLSVSLSFNVCCLLMHIPTSIFAGVERRECWRGRLHDAKDNRCAPIAPRRWVIKHVVMSEQDPQRLSLLPPSDVRTGSLLNKPVESAYDQCGLLARASCLKDS